MWKEFDENTPGFKSNPDTKPFEQELDEEEPVELIYDNEYEWKTDAAEEEEPDERRGEIEYYTKDELKQGAKK